jgi:hypothetical protein
MEPDDARQGTATGRLRSTPSTLGRRRHLSLQRLAKGTAFLPRSSDLALQTEAVGGSHRNVWLSQPKRGSPRADGDGRLERGSASRRPPPRKRGASRPPGRRAAAEVFGSTQPPPRPPGRSGTGHQATRRSPREIDDGRPLDVAPGAVPLGTALLREQVSVGSAGPSAACCRRNCTEGGWSAVTTAAAGLPAARASARGGHRPSQAAVGGTLRRSRADAPASCSGRARHDTASVEQTFNGRSPREHRAIIRLQRRTVVTDSPTDQGLEVEESGTNRSTPPRSRGDGERHHPGPTARRHGPRWPVPPADPTPGVFAASACRARRGQTACGWRERLTRDS